MPTRPIVLELGSCRAFALSYVAKRTSTLGIMTEMESIMPDSGAEGGAGPGQPSWWAQVRGPKWQNKKLAKAFDEQCTKLLESRLWPEISRELSSLDAAQPSTGLSAARVVLSAFFCELDLACSRRQVDFDLQFAVRAILEPSPPLPFGTLGLDVAATLSRSMYQSLFGSKSEASDFQVSEALGRRRILPFADNWPRTPDQARVFFEERLTTYDGQSRCAPPDIEACKMAAYIALAVGRSRRAHPHQGPAIPDALWYEAIALLCLAVLRFRTALASLELSKSEVLQPVDVGRAAVFQSMDFVDVWKGNTGLAGTSLRRQDSGVSTVPVSPPVPSPPPVVLEKQAASIVVDLPNITETAAPTADGVPSTRERTTTPPLRASLGRTWKSTPNAIVLGFGVFTLLALMAIFSRSSRTDAGAPSRVEPFAARETGQADSTAVPVPASAAVTPTTLVETCEKRQGLINPSALIDGRLQGENGKHYGVAHLVAALTGEIPALQRVLVTAPSGLGKSTLADLVTSTVCKARPGTFLLRPGHLRDELFRENRELRPGDWLQLASGAHAAKPDVTEWLAKATPIVVIDGFDEIRGPNLAEFLMWIDRVQVSHPDARFLVLERSSQSLELAGRNYDSLLRLPRLSEEETLSFLTQLRGSKSRADLFLASAAKFGLTRVHEAGGRKEFRFLATFDDIRAANMASDSEALHSRREVFEKWLMLRLPKILNLTGVDPEQLGAWLDGFLSLHVSGPPEHIGKRSSLLAACRQATIDGPVPATSCDVLFSRESLVDDNEGPGDHTVLSLLVARGVANLLAQAPANCSVISQLDRDSAGFLLGWSVAQGCAYEILGSICSSTGGDVAAAVDMVDAGLDYGTGNRQAWFHRVELANGAANPRSACVAEVIQNARRLGVERQ